MLISKIRKYSWLVVGLIAISLIAFLFQSISKSQTGGIFHKDRVPEFATVYGNEITSAEFETRRGEAMQEYLTFNNLLLQYFQGQYQVDARTEFGVGEQAWTEFINEKLVTKQTEALGITITDDEYSDLIYGPDPHPVIKNYYIGLSQTGQYDASLLPGWVDQISNKDAQNQNPQFVQEYYQFISRETVAKRDYLETKYMDLFNKAVYVPEWIAKHNYKVMNSRVNFTYAMLPYTEIADSTIKVSDEELKKYYNENKNKYKQTEGRVLEYVSWEFTPTAGDSAAALKSLMESVEKMKAAKNDSIFIATRSDDPDRFGRGTYSRSDLYAQGVDSSIVDSFYARPVGSLVGPYYEGNYFKVAKIKNRTNMPDSVDARHILVAISAERDSVTAKSIADSLLNLLNNGANFDTLAMNNSDDGGSRDKGGDLGWSTPSINFVAPFKDYLFKTGKVGETKIVKTEFGYHIINIKEIKNRKDFVNLAFLSKQIQPSKETVDSLDRLANKFYSDYQTPEAFNKGVIENKLLKRPTQPLLKSTFEVPGIPDSRQIITWSFGAKKDEFKYFQLSDRIVVAYLKEIKVNGIADLENVREQVEMEVIKEKKGEMLTEKLKGAGSDLNSIAAKLSIPVDTSRNASLGTPYAQGVGLEPKVVGTSLALDNGKTSAPIAGNRGAYVVLPFEFVPAPETKDYTLNLNQLTYSWQQKIQQQALMNELKEKAKVEDNRYLFGN